jgi:hypothetical protein
MLLREWRKSVFTGGNRVNGGLGMEAPLPPFSPVQWVELLGRGKSIGRLVLSHFPAGQETADCADRADTDPYKKIGAAQSSPARRKHECWQQIDHAFYPCTEQSDI